MEEAVRKILRDALLPKSEEEFGLGSRIAALFRDLDVEDEPQRLPRSAVRPMTFD